MTLTLIFFSAARSSRSEWVVALQERSRKTSVGEPLPSSTTISFTQHLRERITHNQKGGIPFGSRCQYAVSLRLYHLAVCELDGLAVERLL